MKLFTYGTLRKNKEYHNILSSKNASFVSNGITIKEYYMDTIKDGYGIEMFPYLLENSDSLYVSNINGEIYEVDTKTINAVDMFEDGYYRKLIDINSEFGIIKCWCYFLNKKVWNKI